MTSSNISNVVTGYQPGAVSKGNIDISKKAEEAQAVFATLMGQANLNTNQQNLPTPEKAKPSVDTVKGSEQQGQVTDRKTKDYTAADLARVKKAEPKDAQITERVEEMAEEVSEEVRKVMEEELAVTGEELDAVLEELGLELLDLLNPAKLAQVVSKLSGVEDISSLLMNEDFVDIMQSFGELTADFAKEAGISAEELQQMLTAEVPEHEAAETVVTEEAFSPEIMPEENAETVVTQEVKETQPVVVRNDVKMQDEEVTVEHEAASETEDAAEVIVTDKNPQEAQNTDEGDAQQQNNGAEDLTQHQKSEKSTFTAEHHTAEHVMASNAGHGQYVTAAEAPVTPVYTGTVNVSEVLQQIAEFVRVNVSQDATSLEMQLNPENLGKLYLHISTTKEGGLTAQFAAQSEAVKEVLEVQVAELRQTLNQQGVKVDSIEVTVATHEFERNLEQSAEGEKQQGQQEEKQQGRRNLRGGGLDGLSGLMTEEEQLAAKIMQENGNSMDVTA